MHFVDFFGGEGELRDRVALREVAPIAVVGDRDLDAVASAEVIVLDMDAVLLERFLMKGEGFPVAGAFDEGAVGGLDQFRRALRVEAVAARVPMAKRIPPNTAAL